MAKERVGSYAYCRTCEKSLYSNNKIGRIGSIVARERAQEHADHFIQNGKEHDVVYFDRAKHGKV